MHLLFLTPGDFLDHWNAVFFSEQPTLTICVFRILVGVLVLVDTWNWSRVYHQLLGPNGWFDTKTYNQHQRKARFSILAHLPATNRSVEGVLIVQAVAALCLALGILPQLAAAVCFFTLVSIHNRNMYALNSGDTVLRFFCLFLIFAPSGSQLSVLHLPQLLNPNARGWPWTLVMIRLFLANVYLKNVLFKLQGSWWRDGTATQKVFGVHLWIAQPLPAWLHQPWFFRLTTYGTLVVETALFSLIWMEEFRIPLVATGIVFHLGLWFFLRVRLFQIAMIAGLLSFVTPEEYAAVFARILG
jgi:hypothetical protein